jgi:hypothetical protein
MIRTPLLVSVAPLFLLTACGSSNDDGKRGADISVDAKTESGSSVAIKADGATGKVSVDVPGFNANVTLPKMMLENGDFDIDGVKLYPGSHVKSVNVNADSSGKDKKAAVKIGFTSPAEIEKVRAWFAKGFAHEGVKATATPTGFAGTTDDDGSFTVTLTPEGAGATTGVVDILGGDGWSGNSGQPTPPKPPSPPPAL